jgi:hypothetical protein
MTITKHSAMLKKCYKRAKVMDEIDSFATRKQNLINKRMKFEKNVQFFKDRVNYTKQQILQAKEGGDTLQLDTLHDDLVEAIDLVLLARQDLRNLLYNGDEDDFQERLDFIDAHILFLRTRLSTDLKL